MVELADVERVAYDYREEHKTLFELAGAVSLAAAEDLAETAFHGNEATIVALGSGANPPKALSPWLDARARRYGWQAA